MGIGIHKHQPITGGRRRPGVTGAGDLIDGFKHDFGAGRAGDIGGAVRGIIVTDNEFDRPAARGQGGGSGLDFRQRGTEEFLLVESGNNDGNIHAVRLSGNT